MAAHRGRSKYDYRTDEETEHIVKLLAQGRTTEDVSRLSGWSFEQVRDIRAEYFPTQSLAKYYLKSNALRLARRIVAEANVEEAVDILSRPNIGVLEPAVKAGASTGPTAVLTSINPHHLGGVQVAVVMGATSGSQPTPTPEGDADAWSQAPEISPTPLALPPATPSQPQARVALPKPARVQRLVSTHAQTPVRNRPPQRVARSARARRGHVAKKKR